MSIGIATFPCTCPCTNTSCRTSQARQHIIRHCSVNHISSGVGVCVVNSLARHITCVNMCVYTVSMHGNARRDSLLALITRYSCRLLGASSDAAACGSTTNKDPPVSTQPTTASSTHTQHHSQTPTAGISTPATPRPPLLPQYLTTHAAYESVASVARVWGYLANLADEQNIAGAYYTHNKSQTPGQRPACPVACACLHVWHSCVCFSVHMPWLAHASVCGGVRVRVEFPWQEQGSRVCV